MSETFELSKFYRNMIESSGTGIIGIDFKETVVVYNQAAEEMMGVPTELVLGQPFSVLLEKTGNTESILLSTLRNRTNYEIIEATIESVSGPINVLAYTNLVFDENGEITGAYLGLRDITPQKQLEEQMFKNEKFSAFGELAAGIAHEVRNPLTSIRGFLQLFDKNLESMDPNKEILHIILKEIERANSIIKQFLLLTKPVIPIQRKTNIHHLIREAALSLQGEASVLGVKIEIREDGSLPSFFIDPEQICQVIVNLAKNAIYAMPNGGTLTLETLYEKLNQKAHIIVADTGIGIEACNVEKVFDPFYTTRAEGAGLGLTVSYKIIQNHGGKMEVQSEVGKGTTFRVILPVKIADSN